MRNLLNDPWRAHYLSLANRASEEPEPPAPDWSENYPLDLPDYDWPDAPDPRVNDDLAAARATVPILITLAAIIVGSLAYLVWLSL